MTFLDTKKLEEKYRNKGLLWGTEPNKFVKKSLKYISSGDVLDVGVGEGRNAIFLAQKGFNVDGIDISKNAIRKCLGIAKEKNNIKINPFLSRAEDFTFKKNYDYILSAATLHLICPDKIMEVISNMQEHTKAGGINLLTVFTDKDAGAKQFPELYFFSENELKQFYKNWKILHFENYTKHEEHDSPHDHHICVIIAKKIKPTQRPSYR